MGLADRAKELVETFSGGMARRVELGKGLLHHPSVLLLDEPTTGLDPGARRDLWQYLQILRDEERVSVIVTTHLMEEAERCDRLAILNEGKLVALGTPTELKHEIGGDVILLDVTGDAESLAQRISTRFSVDATVLGNQTRAHQVRIEMENGHRFITGAGRSVSGRDSGRERQQADAGRRIHPPHRPPFLDRDGRSPQRVMVERRASSPVGTTKFEEQEKYESGLSRRNFRR